MFRKQTLDLTCVPLARAPWRLNVCTGAFFGRSGSILPSLTLSKTQVSHLGPKGYATGCQLSRQVETNSAER